MNSVSLTDSVNADESLLEDIELPFHHRKKIDYCGNHLVEIPYEIFTCFNLEIINLSNNSIKEVPEEFSYLSNLKEINFANNQLGQHQKILYFPFSDLTSIDLSNNLLDEVPQRFRNLNKLKYLNLNNNCIQELPNFIKNLTSLEVLNLDNNQLTTISTDIYYLSSLVEFSAYKNRISTLQNVTFPPNLKKIDLGNNLLTLIHPSQFSFTNSLEILRLSSNKLCFLDEELFLWQLSSLKELYLAANQFKDLPCSIGKLSKLVCLNISNNMLIQLPNSFGRLVSLESLYLQSNSLYSLPRSFGNLKQLKYLDISGNQLITLPQTIEYMSSLHHCKLSNNALQSLPHTLVRLPNLELLEITPGNESITSPPIEVCAKGVQAIYDYLSKEPDSLQEGWELIDPSPEDEDKLFDMTANNTDPYLAFDPELTPSQLEQEQMTTDESSWLVSVISYPFSTLKSYVWG